VDAWDNGNPVSSECAVVKKGTASSSKKNRKQKLQMQRPQRKDRHGTFCALSETLASSAFGSHHRLNRQQVPSRRCNTSDRQQNDNPKTADFLMYVHQKSMKPKQIIPVFTLVWDDEIKEQREKIGLGFTPRPAFLLSLCLSKSCEVS
jgi:hypothetical protein